MALLIEPIEQFRDGKRKFEPWQTDFNNAASFAQLILWTWRNQNQQRERLVKRVLRNLAWLAGDQYVRYNSIKQQFELPPDVPGWRIQAVFNMIYPWCETRLSRLVREKMTGETRPASNDEQDVAVARLQKSVLHSYHDFLKIPRKNREALMWLFCSGYIGWKTYWDAGAGEQISVMPEDLPPEMLLQYQLLGKKPSPVNQGEIACDIVPAIEMLYYPLSIRDVRKSIVKIHSMELEANEVAARYGHLGVTREDAIRHGRLKDEPDLPRRSTYSVNALSESDGNEIGDDCMCLVHEGWLRPMPGFPKGKFVVIFGDGTPIDKESKDSPYYKGKDPFTFMHEKPVPDTLAGTCTVREAISVQDQINRSINTLATWQRWHAYGKWVRYEQDNMTPLLNDDPHQVIKVRSPAHKPEALVPPSIGSDNDRLMMAVERTGNYIVGVNDVTRGDAGGVRTAAQTEMLQSMDDSRFAIPGEAMNEAQADIYTKILEIAQVFVPEQRLARVVGEKNYPDLIYWKGTDLRPRGYGQPGIETGVDVIVTSYTKLGMSPIAKRNTIKELAAVLSGIQDARLKRMVLKAYDVGDEAALYDDEAVHRSRANEKINSLSQGIPIGPPEVQEDEMVHHDVFVGWMNTAEYREVCRKIPPVAEAAKTYLEQCLQQAEDKAASDQYRVAMGQARMGMKYALMSGGMVGPMAFGAVDANQSARRQREAGRSGKALPAPNRPPQPPGQTPESGNPKKSEKNAVDTTA